MSKSYGLPYKGSKNSIAEWVVEHLHSRENFYDVFCGGCAITHRALLTDKFQHIYINDIDTQVVDMFIKALNGEYVEEYKRWISREEFFKLKDIDPIVKYCWSFGNKGDTYVFGKDREDMKYALYLAVVYDDFFKLNTFVDIDKYDFQNTTDVYDKLRQISKYIKVKYPDKAKFFNTIEPMLRTKRVHSIEQLKSRSHIIEYSNKDYSDITIKPNSIIYCDIPYKGTDTYNKIPFDYERFYKWCENQTELVVISEYSMPEDRFECIDAISKTVKLSKDSNSIHKDEKLFIPKHQKELIKL